MMTDTVTPYSLKDAPALIERLLPVQKLSAESYKEQMAGSGKTLTALGSYWKGRKPLILAKACVLGCLLPATDDPVRDLEIFEMLMGMDEASFSVRTKNSRSENETPPCLSYRERVCEARRPEEVMETVHDHIWGDINRHFGTNASSFPELIEQLGIMRFGHRPRVADTFCGSGQIPFEAARLGCDTYASDLNPIACMLTWGAFNIVGGSYKDREQLDIERRNLVQSIREQIGLLDIESDGHGWQARAFLYCLEVRCPQTNWMVPLLPTRLVRRDKGVIAELIPDSQNRRYNIQIRIAKDDDELQKAEIGTIGRDSRYDEAYLIHNVGGIQYKTKISTLRGEHQNPDGSSSNNIRAWNKQDLKPLPNDIFQERLYCVQWLKRGKDSERDEIEFRSATIEDLSREQIVEKFVSEHLQEWQEKGWLPDLRIEPGGPPRYQGSDLIKKRGWTYWHQVFNPRQLLLAGLVNKASSARLKFGLMQVLNNNCRGSRWHSGVGKTVGIFDNQAINVLFNYGCRASVLASDLLLQSYKSYPLQESVIRKIDSIPADKFSEDVDIFITDPPYGDAVKYEEILDFFIAWLRKDPPPEFANWVWDSRRSLAIKGEDEDFRRGMVAAYKRMTECMPDNGIQVIMFTHQSGSIWADMANIVWASGLRVTAGWYVATETDTSLREGSFVKGTVLLVCRKRLGALKTSRDDLAWELQEEVEAQVANLVGLNQKAKGLYRDENVFEDADIQMAGYAAALRVLTRYSTIDGRDMTAEAVRPRVKGETTFVDSLIEFAVNTANQCLVPQGIEKRFWDRLGPAERFYLTMLDQESRGAKKLDNYQNFAKAFKVHEFRDLMGSEKANSARLKSAVEFGRDEMNESSELYQSVLRAVLYGVMELQKEVDGSEVLAHLTLNIPDYYGDVTQRELAAELAGYLAGRLEGIRPEEASAARVLRELVKNQRLG